ncbi:hypothetical protein BV25DRAFT_1843271 [Artomyces pyxidatus]|uniref:Uncharacterized protein n=1 Tax=Artomyces pyxidatus TaxID=48021 RepID=A0ACB8SFM3_9AGAM|nr:hypothetical protein BV25DRAFT_1843271 [Artomyces pyxidatus]
MSHVATVPEIIGEPDHLTHEGEDQPDRVPGSLVSTISSILTRSILRASRQVDYKNGYFSVTERPDGLWSDVKGPDDQWLRTPEKLTFDPYECAITLTIVGRIASLVVVDDLGLPVALASSTFSPFYDADRTALLSTLDLYSDLPEECFPFQAETGNILVERYLPDDTSVDSALFVPFNAVFDGRAGYLPPSSLKEMPKLPVMHLGLNDLVVYALTVERNYPVPMTNAMIREFVPAGEDKSISFRGELIVRSMGAIGRRLYSGSVCGETSRSSRFTPHLPIFQKPFDLHMAFPFSPYETVIDAVYNAGLHQKVDMLNEWDDPVTGIMSISKLAQALGLIPQSDSVTENGVVVADTPGSVDQSDLATPSMDVEWRPDMSPLTGCVTESLYPVGGQGPVRMWMVGVLDDHDFKHFADHKGYAFTTMRPLYAESINATNALLASWTSELDRQYFNWFKPSDIVNASTDTADHFASGAAYPWAHDEPSVIRWARFCNRRLFDARDVEDPLQATEILSHEDFENGDLVLQECMVRRSRFSINLAGLPALELRYVYKLSGPIVSSVPTALLATD